MSGSEQFSEGTDQPAPAPEKKGGGCLKVFLILGGLGFVAMLVCCGAAAYFGRSFVPKITQNPAEVTALGQQILQIEIPDDFVGETAFSMDNFAMSMRMANFKQSEGKGTLVLGDVQIKMGDPKQKEAMQSNPNMGAQPRNLQMRDTVARDFEIRGKTVPFRFSDAHDSDSNKECKVVEANLDSPAGVTFIKLIMDADAYDEEAVVKMIESIR